MDLGNIRNEIVIGLYLFQKIESFDTRNFVQIIMMDRKSFQIFVLFKALNVLDFVVAQINHFQTTTTKFYAVNLVVLSIEYFEPLQVFQGFYWLYTVMRDVNLD